MTLTNLPQWALSRLTDRTRLAMEDASYGARMARTAAQEDAQMDRARRFQRVLDRLSMEHMRRAK
jgi:hypothetical protein